MAGLRILLAALAYASSALAAAVTLWVLGHGTWAMPAVAWFAVAWVAVWGASRGAPSMPAVVRRVVDAAGMAVVVMVAMRAFQAAAVGEDWGAMLPVALVLLQMLRAFVVTTPAEAESFLATGLALALYCATRTTWVEGAVFLGVFMWLWMAAMVLVQLCADTDRRERAGGLVAATASPWRTMRSGLGLSLVAAGLGVGSFLVLAGPAGKFGQGSGSAARRPGGAGAWLYDTAMSFASQAGRHAPAAELFRIRAPRSVSRFRLQAYDTYGTEGWTLSKSETTALPEGAKVPVPYALGLGIPSGVEGEEVGIEVTASGGGGDALLTAGWPLEFDGEFPGALLADGDGGVRTTYPFPAGFRYRLRTWRPAWDRLPLAAAPVPGPDRIGERYLALPASLPARVVARAGSWSLGAASPWNRVLNLAAALRTNRGYQLDLASPPGGGSADPVEYFLFDAARGNCVNFASAMAVMARAVGVPARLVVGYLAHRYDDGKGEWLVTSLDGHAWCEVALEGMGWVPVDPVPAARVGEVAVGGSETPAPSSEPVAAEAVPGAARLPAPVLAKVSGLARALSVALPWIVLGLALGWFARATWRAVRARFGDAGSRRARRAAGEIQRVFQRVCEAAERDGRPRREAQTPVEYARSLRGIFPALAADLVQLAELATRAEYAADGPTAEMMAEAKALGGRLVAALAKG